MGWLTGSRLFAERNQYANVFNMLYTSTAETTTAMIMMAIENADDEEEEKEEEEDTALFNKGS